MISAHLYAECTQTKSKTITHIPKYAKKYTRYHQYAIERNTSQTQTLKEEHAALGGERTLICIHAALGGERTLTYMHAALGGERTIIYMPIVVGGERRS